MEQGQVDVDAELWAWRREHPRATLREIEGAVGDAVARLHARYMQELAHTSPAAKAEGGGSGDSLACPSCGAKLQPLGYHEREVLIAGQEEPLRLRRRYARCPACGTGLFPPG